MNIFTHIDMRLLQHYYCGLIKVNFLFFHACWISGCPEFLGSEINAKWA